MKKPATPEAALRALKRHKLTYTISIMAMPFAFAGGFLCFIFLLDYIGGYSAFFFLLPALCLILAFYFLYRANLDYQTLREFQLVNIEVKRHPFRTPSIVDKEAKMYIAAVERKLKGDVPTKTPVFNPDPIKDIRTKEGIVKQEHIALSTINCPRCGYINDDKADFCVQCGAPLPQKKTRG